MQLRKLYRTVETIASKKFENDEELLSHVLHEIIHSEQFKINGGRIWKFDSRSGTYSLMYQTGDMEKIAKNYKLKVNEYPLFLQLADSRTVLANEQDQYLRNRGILKYSATGVGEKIVWRGKPLYRYVLAFNAEELSDNLPATLNIISAALSSVLRSKKIEQKAKVLERDLDKARDIQKSILPQHEMHFQNYELYGVSLADRIVGGDFFDYLQAEGDQDRLGVVIGDAASKGVSAAVQALYVSGALRMGFEYQTKISVLLSRVNKLVSKTFTQEQFVSLFYCELANDKNGLVLYANCGHNSPMHYHADTGKTDLIEPTGQLIGPFENESFHAENFHMKKNDILLLYTDGVTEARNHKGEFYGEETLTAELAKSSKGTAREITQHLLEHVQTFSAGDEYSDDKTIVAIKRIKA
ncbi:MAG TPA: PP2C family protein-serine/threonine phosphatase [Bacteroidota bacterium]|nr:PP2C family protein-serine/threonine phosphatase [Bacteroidota bacterium]